MMMCADGVAAAKMGNDYVRVLIANAVFLAVAPCDRLLVEAMEYSVPLDPGKASDLCYLLTLIDDNGVSDEIGLAILLSELTSENAAKAGSVAESGGKMLKVIQELIVDGIGSAAHGLYDTAPADESINGCNVDIVFLEQIPDELHTHRSLIDDVRILTEFLGRMADGTLIDAVFAVENSDLGGGGAGVDHKNAIFLHGEFKSFRTALLILSCRTASCFTY